MSQFFWIASTTDLSMALHVAPSVEGVASSYEINVYAPRGEHLRHYSLEVPYPAGCTLELDSVLTELLPENGIKHALLSVRGGLPGSVCLRMLTKSGHIIVPPAPVVTTSQPTFFPKTFSRQQSSYLSLMNCSSDEIEVTVRIVAHNRAPESVVNIGANETKLIHLETEFADLTDLSKKQRLPAYVRARTKSEGALAAVMLDQIFQDNGVVYRMVTA